MGSEGSVATGRRRESEDNQREIHSDPCSALSSNHWLSSPTGRPVAMPRLTSPLAVPATPRCAPRWTPAKRDRQQHADTALAQRTALLETTARQRRNRTVEGKRGSDGG